MDQESVKHQESVVHDIRGMHYGVYDYMMMEVCNGGVCIHDEGIAIMCGAWPVAIFSSVPADRGEVHFLLEDATWSAHLADKFFQDIYRPEQLVRIHEGLLLAWAIACG